MTIPESFTKHSSLHTGIAYEVFSGDYNGSKAICKRSQYKKYIEGLRTESQIYSNDILSECRASTPELYYKDVTDTTGCIIVEYCNSYVPTVNDWENREFRRNLFQSISEISSQINNSSIIETCGKFPDEVYSRGEQIIESYEHRIDECLIGNEWLQEQYGDVLYYVLELVKQHSNFNNVIHSNLSLESMGVQETGYVDSVFSFQEFGVGEIVSDYAKLLQLIGQVFSSTRVTTSLETVSEELYSELGLTRKQEQLANLYRILYHFDRMNTSLNGFAQSNIWDSIGGMQRESYRMHKTILNSLISKYIQNQ